MTSSKIHALLTIILVAFLGILARVWHLGIIQRDAKWIEAQKPQSRTLLQRADRGTICDRFGIPLATNRICYHAAIYYDQITQIPSVRWQEDSSGKKVKTYPRKEYIQKLAEKLSSELNMEAMRIEDLIYSKASLFPHTPYAIKAGLSEKEHYRLKNLESDWPGLHAEIAAERYYPQGPTGCHIIGTMGAISAQKYQSIAEKLQTLQEAAAQFEQGELWMLPLGFSSFESLYASLHELKEKAYTLSDLVGKTGIEGQFEEDLRGFFGKKIFEVDQKGRLGRELPGGRSATAGRKIVLSISSELQQFAEQLLAMNETQREGRLFRFDPIEKKRKQQKDPWLKGGAIVALDPSNGEVLALASYPRFDPNDFIPTTNIEKKKERRQRLLRWLEGEEYLASLWDGTIPLCRERFNRRFFDEEFFLSWNFYLDQVLPKEGALRQFFENVSDVRSAISVQEDFETIRFFSHAASASEAANLFGKAMPPSLQAIGSVWKRLDPLLSPIACNEDRLFAIDLCRLSVDSTRFSDALIEKIGSTPLAVYRDLCMQWLRFELKVKEKQKGIFHTTDFLSWRKENQASFLMEARKKEKERKLYPKPYLDYLDAKENDLFQQFWVVNRFKILQENLEEEPLLKEKVASLPEELKEEFLKTFRSFKELDRPLLATAKWKTEKELAQAFFPSEGFGAVRSYAFQTSAPLGSFFKLIAAYEGLRQGRNLLLIDDRSKNPKYLAYGLDGTAYPRIYKGGRIPQSSPLQIGKIDILGALERSSNAYFSILAGDELAHPEDLKIAAKRFGYGEKTGIALPGETAGNLPDDLASNRTSLYSFAIGQHTMLATPLQTAVALSAIGNSGDIFQPNILLGLSGLLPNREELSKFSIQNSPLEYELKTLGIPFSLFTGMESKNPIMRSINHPSHVQKTVLIPALIREQLLEGMDRSLWSKTGGARSGIIRFLRSNPALVPDYLALEHQMLGKTSTAQILYNPYIHPSSKAEMFQHIWFSALSFKPDRLGKIRFDHPELVVVVFFRFGEAGKEAAPIAAQMIKKWREIQERSQSAIERI